MLNVSLMAPGGRHRSKRPNYGRQLAEILVLFLLASYIAEVRKKQSPATTTEMRTGLTSSLVQNAEPSIDVSEPNLRNATSAL